MTDQIKIGIEAVNRWLFHGWNYESVPVPVPDYENGGTKQIYVPRFIAEAKWTTNRQHMIEKWNAACRSGNTDAYLVNFYANLDNDNRIILVEWVLENYTGERKLF